MIEKTEVRMTLNDILDSSCAKFGNLPALGTAMEKPLTYNELRGSIFSLATYMFSRVGIKKGDHVAILAENSKNWAIAYFAVIRLGAVVVPILPDFPEGDVNLILSEMKVKALFITHPQIEKIYDLQNTLACIISLDDFAGVEDVFEVRPFSECIELASFFPKEQSITFPEVVEDDLASIIYTSGTTGFSKAVMLTHKNLSSSAHSAVDLGFEKFQPGDVLLSILPMSHTYEFTCGLIAPLLKGCKIAYAGQSPTPAILQKLCQHEKPALILTVPLVFEKIYKKRVLPKIEKSRAVSLLCKTGFGRRLVYKRIGAKLMEFFGGNLKFIAIGGASLNPVVEGFLFEAKFPYVIGYGMTEAAPMIACFPFGDPTNVPGSTGKPMPGVQVKINDSDPANGIGEIVVRGPNVMQGYYNDIEKTKETITNDGWLLTGDLGFIDEFGNIHIRGRSKNVIVMANGENVYPEGIEHEINVYNWVVESLIVENDGKLEAWVYPDYEFIDEQTAYQPRTRRHEHLVELMETMRSEINGQLPKASRIARVCERREPFVKTATHKIKRYFAPKGNISCM